MKRSTTTHHYLAAPLLALALLAGRSRAQTAPSPSADSSAASASSDTGDSSDSKLIVLDPFTVTSEHEGYQAVDTLAGGRIRTKLTDTPSSISVITKKFMDDLGITNATNLLVYTNDTEVSGLGGNFSGVVSRGSGANGEGSLLVDPSNGNRARGLAAMDQTRNYFPTDIPWDGYDISRVDIARGPNSFLFGFGSPAGISNYSTNDALFANKGDVEARYGSFGSTRESLDLNQVLIPKELAARLDLVNDDEQYMQKPAFNHTKRAYVAMRFDPKIFSTDSSHMKITANFEVGNVRSNNPRFLPPLDYVTGYLNDPKASATGYNPWTYVQDGSGYTPQYSGYSSHGSLANEFQWSNALTYFWDAPTGTLQKAGQAEFTTPPNSSNWGVGTFVPNNVYFVHSTGYSNAATLANYVWRLNNANGADPATLAENSSTPFPGAYSGTVQYFDKTLSDPSIFDFYHKLLDGNNKREWQNWKAFSLNLTESLFDGRLAIQASADHQEYQNGQEGMLDQYTIALDLDSYLLTYPTWLPGMGQPNPNVGRPAIFGGSGNGNRNDYRRDNYQVTANYNLDVARDFGAKGLLAHILGKHEITGLFGSYDDKQHLMSYHLYGVDQNWNATYNGAAATDLSQNGIDWTAYLGPSLLGTKGTGANLSNLNFSLAPVSTNVVGYNKTWTAGASVKPTDSWQTITAPPILQPDGTMSAPQSLAMTQADNPANYAGYTTSNPSLLNSGTNMNLLRTGASMLEQKIESDALMYQGHLWDDTIIPTFGWRRDKTIQRGNVAMQTPTTNLVPDVTGISDPGVVATTTSTSYGIAVHLPQSIRKNLPEGTDVTFYYFHGNNETPKVRYAIDGSQLPNETGKTNDYSVEFDGLKGRARLRLTYFDTTDNHAAASYGQPLGAGVGWLISSLPAWTVSMASAGIAAAEYGPNNMGAMSGGGNQWFWQWGVDHPDVAEKVKAVLQNQFLQLYPQSWWTSYGYNINVAKIKAGDWLHIMDGQSQIFPWDTGGSTTIHGQTTVIDQNVESKGYEIEATVRPLPNWDLTFNGSDANAKQTSLGASASKYLNEMAQLWMNSDLGQTAEWGSYTAFGTMKRQFLTTLWGPYLTQVALTGTEQPEWSKWKFNGITNYMFDRGFLKGVNIGGAYRWEDRKILGYGIKQAVVAGTETYLSDVSKPLWGPYESHFDLWVGYHHKLSSGVDWKIQLNVQNVGEHVHLVPIQLEPDGSVATSRIANGQEFTLTSRFSF